MSSLISSHLNVIINIFSSQQQPPLYLVAEPNELVKVAAVKIKAKIRDWAKAVASSTSKQLSVANEKCKLSTCS